MNYGKLLGAALLSLTTLAAGAGIARAEESRTGAAGFEALKKLAGEWVQIGKDGKVAGPVVSSIRVTAAGTAVEETLFPGTAHEMVTMYHLDGGELVLTHYCALGNQPHMRLTPESKTGQLDFQCDRTGNLSAADDMHIDHAKLTILGPDHFQAIWTACKEGKACHEEQFDLARKK